MLERNFEQKSKDLERPEVTMLTGVLLGYKPCCIEYYVDVTYLGGERYGREKIDPVDNHILCAQCAAA